MTDRPAADSLAAKIEIPDPQKPGLAPVERWNPPLSGDMDIVITRDGVWLHEGRPIERKALVRLFSTILRHDEDGGYYLVTPVERWRIQVDDAPFVAVLLDVEGANESQRLHFITNVGDTVTAGPEHPIEVIYAEPGGEPAPYIHVRGRLRALIARPVFVELAELAVARKTAQGTIYGVWSQGRCFELGKLEA